jgi:hypothetical protein
MKALYSNDGQMGPNSHTQRSTATPARQTNSNDKNVAANGIGDHLRVDRSCDIDEQLIDEALTHHLMGHLSLPLLEVRKRRRATYARDYYQLLDLCAGWPHYFTG